MSQQINYHGLQPVDSCATNYVALAKNLHKEAYILAKIF
jgi:hypothetical protein